MHTNALVPVSPVRALSTVRLDPSLPRAQPAPRSNRHRDQVCLIGAKDSYHSTYSQVCEVAVPDARFNAKDQLTYQPVPFATLLDGLRDSFSAALDCEPIAEDYALSNQGQELYGMMTWRLPESEHSGLALALRSSYNSNIAPAFGVGEAVFVCANGSFSVDGMIKSARQTTNVMDTLRELTSDVSSTAISDFRAMAEETAGWRDVAVKDDLFYAYCGLLFGRKVISAQLFSTAIKYWNACRDGSLHREHATENLWSAYQAVTAAMQRSGPRDSFRGYGGLHHVTRAVFNSGGCVEGSSQIPSLDVEAVLKSREYSAAN